MAPRGARVGAHRLVEEHAQHEHRWHEEHRDDGEAGGVGTRTDSGAAARALETMKRLVDWVQGFALALGGPGLFLIALLDSSLLSFPEVADLLVIWLTIQHPHRMLYYALMATLGSIAGCFLLFLLARKGGEAFLRKRFHERHIDRAMGVVRKYGLLSVLIPSLLPPPMPFKIFVLAAGIARVRVVDFLLAVTLGRGIRYFGEGLLALYYGERAGAFLRDNARSMGIAIAGLAFAGGIAWIMWGRRRRRRAARDEQVGPPPPR